MADKIFTKRKELSKKNYSIETIASFGRGTTTTTTSRFTGWRCCSLACDTGCDLFYYSIYYYYSPTITILVPSDSVSSDHS